jgi:hypothetical protein
LRYLSDANYHETTKDLGMFTAKKLDTVDSEISTWKLCPKIFSKINIIVEYITNGLLLVTSQRVKNRQFPTV